MEVRQAIAGGRYRHKNDTHIAPIDRDFGGSTRIVTYQDGQYVFSTVTPGAYPSASGFAQRPVTQTYPERHPLIPSAPILGPGSFGTIPCGRVGSERQPSTAWLIASTSCCAAPVLCRPKTNRRGITP
jgi:hypothetical protein